MSTYTITLGNGTVLDGLTMNGSMFVSQTEITKDLFTPEALKQVTIVESDGETTRETVLHNALCDTVLHWPEGYLFNLRELGGQEKQIHDLQEQNQMLTDCILEMSEILYGGE